MDQPTSRLWTRRMTNRSADRPFLSPLFQNTNYDPIITSYSISSNDASTPLRPIPSSPSLYTPTEAIGILLGQTPLEAAQSTRLAVEAATANLKVHCQGEGRSCYSSPNTPLQSPRHAPDGLGANDRSSYLLHSLSLHQEEFNLEIDTAALATEVALHVLAPPIDANSKARKIRLVSTFDMQPKNVSLDQSPDSSQGDKPVRKGRARMSQEKRKRLARRKEREALLLGIPPKPLSAPPHLTHFSSSLQHTPGQGNIAPLAWKQSRPSWYRQTAHASQDRDSTSTSECGKSTITSDPPSLIVDGGSPSTQYTMSPSASPEAMTNARLAPPFRMDLYHGNNNEKTHQQSNPPWQPIEDRRSQVPRLSLQPPSPQHIRQQPIRNNLGLRNAAGNVSFPSLSELRWS